MIRLPKLSGRLLPRVLIASARPLSGVATSSLLGQSPDARRSTRDPLTVIDVVRSVGPDKANIPLLWGGEWRRGEGPGLHPRFEEIITLS